MDPDECKYIIQRGYVWAGGKTHPPHRRASQSFFVVKKWIETSRIFSRAWHIFKSNTNLHFLYPNGTGGDFLFAHKFFTYTQHSFLSSGCGKFFSRIFPLPCLSFILNSNSIIFLSISRDVWSRIIARNIFIYNSPPAPRLRLIMQNNSRTPAHPKLSQLNKKQIHIFSIPQMPSNRTNLVFSTISFQSQPDPRKLFTIPCHRKNTHFNFIFNPYNHPCAVL